MDDLFGGLLGEDGGPQGADAAREGAVSDVTLEVERRAGELVRIISDALEELAGLPIDAVRPDVRLALLRDVGKQATSAGAVRDLVVASVERDQAWSGRGTRTFPDHVQRVTGSSKREAKKTVDRATALDESLPLFRTAFVRGEITQEKIDAVTRMAKSPPLKAQLKDSNEGEAHLLRQAKAKDADAFGRAVRAWAMKHAPKESEEELKTQTRNQRLALVEDSGGFALSGWFTALNGEILKTALTAIMGVPTQTDTRQPMERRADALLELATITLDEGRVSKAATVRPHLSIHVPFELLEGIAPQKGAIGGHEATCGEATCGEATCGEAGCRESGCRESGCRESGCLEGVWDAQLRESGEGGRGISGDGPPGGRMTCGDGPPGGSFRGGKIAECLSRVHDQRKRLGEILSVIRAGIDDDLLSGSPPATLDDGTPIHYSQVQTLLCSGELQRIVLTREGEVLDLGRSHRTANRQQTRAVITRDRTCRYPGCAHTISASEIHHADHFGMGGATDLDNLVMLCWYHHQYVHREKITITHHQHGWSFDSPTKHVGTRFHESRNDDLDRAMREREVT